MNVRVTITGDLIVSAEDVAETLALQTFAAMHNPTLRLFGYFQWPEEKEVTVRLRIEPPDPSDHPAER